MSDDWATGGRTDRRATHTGRAGDFVAPAYATSKIAPPGGGAGLRYGRGNKIGNFGLKDVNLETAGIKFTQNA